MWYRSCSWCWRKCERYLERFKLGSTLLDISKPLLLWLTVTFLWKINVFFLLHKCTLRYFQLRLNLMYVELWNIYILFWDKLVFGYKGFVCLCFDYFFCYFWNGCVSKAFVVLEFTKVRLLFRQVPLFGGVWLARW